MKENMLYAVIRNCCFGVFSGCDRCHTKPKEKILLIQYATIHEAKAKEVAKNWEEYGATVEEVTAETYKKLPEWSSDWLKRSFPGHYQTIHPQTT